MKNTIFKEVSELIYSAKDPVDGGTWQYVAKTPKTDEEILSAIKVYLVFYGKKRPQEGEVVILRQPALD
jgi:hypothetical protein